MHRCIKLGSLLSCPGSQVLSVAFSQESSAAFLSFNEFVFHDLVLVIVVVVVVVVVIVIIIIIIIIIIKHTPK